VSDEDSAALQNWVIQRLALPVIRAYGRPVAGRPFSGDVPAPRATAFRKALGD
jgi:hypothetical protein